MISDYDVAKEFLERIERLSGEVADRNDMIYRLADYVRGHWDAMKNDGDGIDEPWDGVLRCLAFCTNPDDPAVLAEAVKAALSLEDYHAES